MSFPDSQSPFVPPGFDTSSDAITINAWPQYPVVSNQGYDHNIQFENPHSLKRPREEENQSDNVALMPQKMPCSSARINTGINNIFFKTRVCAKFKLGLCRNGESCKFAHGVEDLRQPPPNWQELVGGREEGGTGNWDDEQRIALKMKLCKKFSNGEVCPYGDKCNFLHEDPKRIRDDSVRFRESSAISIGAPLNAVSGHGGGLNQTDLSISNAGSDAYRMNMRTEHWKTKLCCKFESNGFCSFGDKCGFAHGLEELQRFVGRAEGIGPFTLPVNPIVGAPNYQASSTTNNAVINEQRTGMKDFSKLKGSKKINRIYGDWIDGWPLDSALT
ncbi:unnamed protein product [Rhodiola kirilowii]